MVNTHFLPVRVDQEDVQRLEALCTLTGLSRIEYLRILVSDALGKQEALMESFNDTSVKLKAMRSVTHVQGGGAAYKATGTNAVSG